jgi:predicted glutamine amidotransferase
MCVIIATSERSKLPSHEIITQCARHNSDGGGFMFHKDGKVHIHKGYITAGKLISDVEAWVPETSPIVIHFRLGTHGSVRPELCHPYPVTKNFDRLCQLDLECSYGVAHNGIFSYTKAETGDYNDTQHFIADTLTDVIRYIEIDGVRKVLIAALGSNKLALLSARGKLRLLGSFEKDNDVWFSNKHWEPITITNNYRGYGASHYKSSWEYAECAGCGELKYINSYTGVCGTCSYTNKGRKSKRWGQCTFCGAYTMLTEGKCSLCSCFEITDGTCSKCHKQTFILKHTKMCYACYDLNLERIGEL